MNENFGGRQVVLKALVGSHNYNLDTSESDEDWKFFVTPTFEDLYKGNRFSGGNQSDEFDFTVHDVRHLSHLLWKANPNFVEVLFSMDFKGQGWFPEWLLENRQRLSRMHLRSFGFACLGMHKEKMSTLFKGTANTQWIVDEFGYDTKDAHHALRVLKLAERVAMGWNVDEALWFNTGSEERQELLDIKNNKVTLDSFKRKVDFWHEHWFEFVEDFFKAQEPNLAMRKELDERTMQFVRDQLT